MTNKKKKNRGEKKEERKDKYQMKMIIMRQHKISHNPEH